MNITIIGSGNMAQGIGSRVITGRHSLAICDRDIDKARQLAAKLSPEVKSQSLSDPLTGDIIIFALPYQAIFEVVQSHQDQLNGKILVDISNPINFQTFELIPPPDTSGAEEIDKLLPAGANLVKAFNTTFAGTLLAGQVDGKPLDVFIASDDELAAQAIVKLASDGGLRGLYVGPLSKARILEGIQLIHMSLQEKLKTNWMSTIKILS